MPTGPALTWGSSGASSGSVSFTRGKHSPADRPPYLSIRVHPLAALLLFEVSSLLLPVAPRPSDHSCQGFVPLRGISVDVHAPAIGLGAALRRCGNSQPPATLRPQVFSTSRRLAPSSNSRACFIPQPRPGFVLAVQGLLPIRSGPRLVAGPCPHAVGPSALTGDPAATREALDFEALFCGAMRSCGSVFSLPVRRSPLRLPPPSGPRSTTVSPASSRRTIRS